MLSEVDGLVIHHTSDIFEVAWPFILKWSAPLSRWAPLFVVIICAVPANYLLAEAVKRLPAATVYVICGYRDCGNGDRRNGIFWREPNIGRVCSLVLIVLELIGLKFFSNAAG